jgi:hypothetical protein
MQAGVSYKDDPVTCACRVPPGEHSPMTLARFAFIPLFMLLAAGMPLLPRAEAQQSSDESLNDARDGLTVNSPAAFRGYTLVAPMNSTSTYLIDMESRIVNEWKSDYPPALSAYLLENGNLLRPGAERGFGRAGPGAGGRIQEFTWEGELVWDYSFGDSKLRPHHDISRLPNGNILVIAADPKTKDEAIAAGRWPDSVDSQLVPDCILEIEPTGQTTGKIVWRWHAWDHLIQDCDESTPNFGEVAGHSELIDVNFGSGMMDRMMQEPKELSKLRSLGYLGGGEDHEPSGNQSGDSGSGPRHGDWMHVNFVAYNAKLDQIMLSVHEFSEVWVIDHSTTTEEAASHEGGRSGRGGDLLYRWGNPQAYRAGSSADQRLYAQHCAHWIEDGLPGAGNMLVFNNGGGRPGGLYSSVDEIEMPVNARGIYEKQPNAAFAPGHASWSYTAPDKSDFFSMLISGAQRLPNGNTFICSGNQALLFEVTPKGEIVWRYKHPGGGLGGPGGMPPRPGELVPGFLQRILAVTDAQKTSIEKLQSDVDEKLTRLLTDEQREKLEQAMKFPFGAPRGPDRRHVGPGPGGPGQQRGPRRGGFRPPRMGTVLPKLLIDELALSEAQRTELDEIQQRVDGRLEEIWTEEQKTRLKEMEESFARGPWFGPPPGFGPPGRFDPPDDDGSEDGRWHGHRGRGGPGAPGGLGRGPGGIFCSLRYAADFPGLAGRDLKPGKKLVEVAATSQPARERPRSARE